MLSACLLVFTIVGVRFEISAASADTIANTITVNESATTAPQTALALTEMPATTSATTASSATAVRSAPSNAQDIPPAPVTKRAPESAAKAAVTVAVQPAATKPVEAAPTAPRAKTLGTSAQYPKRLVIPSLKLDVPIQAVGVNAKGEMAVPSGNSGAVGWYKNGTMPGNVGSAVLDAHVFAVFEDLKYLKIGSDIFVTTEGGTKLRFSVVDSRIYTLPELTSDMLFNRKDARRLNLITCAGTYIPSLGTYDHRLVVYAIFQDEE
jgi:sortase (surface protein transpeptidase)